MVIVAVTYFYPSLAYILSKLKYEIGAFYISDIISQVVVVSEKVEVQGW